MAEGWICIARKITEWEWYSDSNVFRLFMHLLLKANFRENRWQGIVISRGQVVTSRGKISDQIGLSIKQIRVAEAKLSSSGVVDVKGANKFTIYTIAKYDDYQSPLFEMANKRQTKGKQKTNKGQHLNNENNDNNNTLDLPPPLPPWLPIPEWEDYKEFRRKINSPMTEKAEQLAIAELEKLKNQGYDPKAVLEQSIMRGWKGLFPLKGNVNEAVKSGYVGGSQPNKSDRAKAAVLRAAVAGGFASEAGPGQQADFGYPSVP
jgi:hypothetical protein